MIALSFFCNPESTIEENNETKMDPVLNIWLLKWHPEPGITK